MILEYLLGCLIGFGIVALGLFIVLNWIDILDAMLTPFEKIYDAIKRKE